MELSPTPFVSPVHEPLPTRLFVLVAEKVPVPLPPVVIAPSFVFRATMLLRMINAV